MYKILLVTDRPEILDAFQAVSSWESLGFRVPRICNSAEGAIACLKAHHVDGIGIRLDMEQEALLMGHLTAFYPILPIFAVSENAGELVESITELRSLLNRTHADFSNDNFGEADMLQVCRHEFFRDLLSERITGKKYVLNHMRLLRSRMDPQAACVMVDLSLPTGEEYLAGRWHYGPERLEVALRNFFGAELKGMRIVVAVVAPDHVRVLCCPMLGTQGEESDSITRLVNEHTMEVIDQARMYLDLELQLTSIRVLPNVTALAEE